MNYLNAFCPSLASVIKPLHNLTKQDHTFLWSSVHEKSFNDAKKLIVNAPCLAFFNSNRPVVLQVDASENGLGAALLQPDADNKLKPVAFTSCLMRQNEVMWAQIEKKTLAICAACEKWDLWLYGKTITVHSDHQPLETIFRKPLAKAPKRLQRLIMRLQRYTLNVVYKKGTSLVLADTLSRSPLPSINTSKQTAFEIFRINLEESVEVENPNLTPKTTAELQMATRHDPVISELACAIRYGWPANKTDLKQTLTPDWPFWDELSILDGIIYRGSQALIPPSMQKHMLKRIHASHLGADSNIRMCRDILFWPGMQAAIRELCSQCEKCAAQRTAQSRCCLIQSQNTHGSMLVKTFVHMMVKIIWSL